LAPSLVLAARSGRHALDYCLPRPFRCAGPAVDTRVRMEVELIRPLLPVGTRVLVDAIDRTHRHAPGVEAVATEAGDNVRHDLPQTRRQMNRWRNDGSPVPIAHPQALQPASTSPVFLDIVVFLW